MLTRYFKRSEFLHRFRSGPVGAYAEGFCKHLEESGFSQSSICHYLGIASHFGHWVKIRHLDLESIDEHSCRIFLKHLCSCRCRPIQNKSRNASAPVRSLIAYLQKLELLLIQNRMSEAYPSSGTSTVGCLSTGA